MKPGSWREVEDIFQEALQRNPAERDAYVREACRGDAELQREVASLLANHHTATGFEPWAAAAAAQLIDTAGSLRPGQSLGPYRIECFLAAGGMGEVYRATDTRLNRAVAIKVSAARFTERFEREARVIASLNHPNICQLHDVGPNYLVMEMVEGPTLAERIREGRLPLDEALTIAGQIADALEAAHERGVVHRDLKPGNVKVKPDGTVKVLDFGLAKAAEAEVVSGNPSHSPTQTISATRTGVILGTAAYMSPEQVQGKPVDRRADIWAFGVVLWGMLTGEQLFQGETVTDTLASILKEAPDFDRVPVKIRPLLRKCLEKDRKRRLRDIGDAFALIENPPGTGEGSRPTSSVLAWTLAAVAALFVLISAVLAFVHFRETPPEARVVIASINPPENTTFGRIGFDQPALSPDGRQIVFTSHSSDGKTQLWVCSLDSPDAQPLHGTEGARFPFWSPDSRSVGFFADGKLKRVDRADGRILILADAPLPGGGSWNSQGIIVFQQSSLKRPLQQVPANGGHVIPATTFDPEHDYSHRFPWFLPDGRHFLFADQPQQGASEFMLRIGVLDSPEVMTIGPANSNAVYSSGYLLYVRQNTLMAQPFDEKQLAVAGEAQPLAAQVPGILPYVPSTGTLGAFSVAREGLLAYRTEAVGSEQLTWFDRSGKPVGTLGGPGEFSSVDFSPDRKSLAVVLLRSQSIWIYDVAQELARPFTFGPALYSTPVWSPDGTSIIYQGNAKGHFDLYRKATDGTGDSELVYAGGANKILADWSPDGRFLLHHAVSWDQPDTPRADAWVLSLGAKGAMGDPSKVFPGLAPPFNRNLAKFSPDGHWVAYGSNESGRQEIYVAPFLGAGPKHQISRAGGNFPRWRADGNEIFFEANGILTAAEVAIKNGSIKVGAIRSLGISVTAPHYKYDVSLDGTRFLVAARREQKSPASLTLVQNWTALLKKK